MSNRLPILAADIRKAHTDVQDAVKTAAERAVDAGHALIEAKELVKHGQWLPWLRENCALPERTAQLYMRIAKSGLKSATIADLGLAAAAKAIVLNLPDPWVDIPADELKEWNLFYLWLVKHGSFKAEGAQNHVTWVQRKGWTAPTEWMGEAGERCRKAWGMRPMPARLRKSWFAYLAENLDRSLSEIESEVEGSLECAA